MLGFCAEVNMQSLGSTHLYKGTEPMSLRNILIPTFSLCGILGLMLYPSGDTLAKPVEARHGMGVSVSAPASDVGLAILKRGGNAVDAAVATAFALAVTFPAAGNIGGRGFLLFHRAGQRKTVLG